ncbi:MAG: helix-turn-helix transcriptional regulator [Actinomycetota bacterium]
MRGNHLVREARKRAQLTQRELADRAGTTQSAIARLERGDYSPTLEHITDLVRACGLEVRVRLVPLDESDWSLAKSNLLLSPSQRAGSNKNAVRFIEAGRKAMAETRRGP